MTKQRTLTNTVAALAFTLCLCMRAVAEAPSNIDIPAGELTTALETVARQAGVELLFQPGQLQGIHTHGVAGTMTTQRAVEKLLEGTPLQLRVDPANGAMMIGAAAAANDSSPHPAAALGTAPSQQEVEINARREKLSVMRAEMVKLEDRFYAEYNRLNVDHQWDVTCDLQAPTGSHVKSRVCQPVFVGDATKVSIGGGSILPFAGGGDGGDYVSLSPSPMSVILAKWPDYEKNMLNQINAHPQLRRLAREREVLGKRYEAARRQKIKGKIIVLGVNDASVAARIKWATSHHARTPHASVPRRHLHRT